MTYRGVYRDGYVRLDGDVDLPNGSTVEVFSLAGARVKRAKSKKKAPRPASSVSKGVWELAMAKGRKMTRAERVATAMKAFGAWRDRPEWKGWSSVEIAAELRRRSTRGVRNG